MEKIVGKEVMSYLLTHALVKKRRLETLQESIYFLRKMFKELDEAIYLPNCENMMEFLECYYPETKAIVQFVHYHSSSRFDCMIDWKDGTIDEFSFYFREGDF